MKILLLKPSSLGDVVQALPVLRLLKRHQPQSQIYWWIESKLAPLLEADPDLAGIIRFNRRGWATPRNWRELWRSLQWIRAQSFDWVIDLQCLTRSGAFAWLANGALTVGLDEPREGARGYYDLIARRPSFYTHAVDWYLSVLPLLGVPADPPFEWLPPQKKVAEALRQKWPLDQARWIVLQPGARWLNKRWPVEHFADLVQRGAAALPAAYRFAVLGGAEDAPLGERICRAAPQRCLDLTGKLSLLEMIECLRLSEAMVTNDTGPMHVAAALGKPVVALLGPTEPCRTGPYGQIQHVLQRNLPCVPCLKARCAYPQPMECLRSISPAAVFAALQKRLSGILSS
ncbi:MAG TPA: lipopolysaccharide heptosyltransferase II [Bacillota bacterium]|nr:lipopolysaccharide heptosyltransferase II [Bacillota bacterium]